MGCGQWMGGIGWWEVRGECSNVGGSWQGEGGGMWEWVMGGGMLVMDVVSKMCVVGCV